MPEQQPVPDEAVKAAQAIMVNGVNGDAARVLRKIETRAAVEAAAPLIRAQAIRDVVEALQSRKLAAERSTWGQAADFILRTFGGDRA